MMLALGGVQYHLLQSRSSPDVTFSEQTLSFLTLSHLKPTEHFPCLSWNKWPSLNPCIRTCSWECQPRVKTHLLSPNYFENMPWSYRKAHMSDQCNRYLHFFITLINCWVLKMSAEPGARQPAFKSQLHPEQLPHLCALLSLYAKCSQHNFPITDIFSENNIINVNTWRTQKMLYSCW